MFVVGDLQHPPPEFFSRFLRYHNWSITGRTESTITVRIEGKVELELTPSTWTVVFSEWIYWKQHYIEFLPPHAKTVLDVGSGCGETALLYFLKGAEKLICLEPDEEKANLLEKNSRRNRWNTTVLRRPFRTSYLKQLQFDFMKMDCEGCESLLLDVEELPPCVIEVHGQKRLDSLTAHFPTLRLANLQTGPKFDLWILGSSSRSKAAHVLTNSMRL